MASNHSKVLSAKVEPLEVKVVEEEHCPICLDLPQVSTYMLKSDPPLTGLLDQALCMIIPPAHTLNLQTLSQPPDFHIEDYFCTLIQILVDSDMIT